jgi:Ca2+-binding RTX toxin-like protein
MATIYGKPHYGYYGHNGDTIDASDGVTNGADVIFGTFAKDTIYGLGGNDVLKGGGGADTLYGGEGTDTAAYGDSSEGVQVSLALGAGTGGTAQGDKLYDIENLSGSNYDDTLEGDANANSLYGEAGNDTLKGGGGADKLFGGAGDDMLNSDGWGDMLDGGSGNDTANFSESATGVHVNLAMGRFNPGIYYQPVPPGTPDNIVDVENVYGSNKSDHIAGSGGDNWLAGNGGGDQILGLAGNDTIDGGAGKDTIYGGEGNDLLTGGTENDIFVFEAAAGNPVNIGHDTIMDFVHGQDRINIDTDVFNDMADLMAHAQQVGSDVVITYDANNSITLHNMTVGSLSASDFLFV